MAKYNKGVIVQLPNTFCLVFTEVLKLANYSSKVTMSQAPAQFKRWLEGGTGIQE